MTQPDDYDAFFHSQLPLVGKLIAGVARRVGLRDEDVEDFASWAKMRLWEHDYAILRKWRRESQLSTYLAVVLTNLGHEFRNKRSGRWRPSAAARRLGRVALLLERLLSLHGMRLDEAGEWLRTRGETTLSDRELAALRARLPERLAPRPAGADHAELDSLPDDATADARLLDEEADAARREAYRLLHAAIARLTPLEQVIVRMYFLDGQTLADVARALGVEQKPLYRIKDAAVRTLKRLLVEGGMTRDALQGLLDGTLSGGGRFDPRDPDDEPDDPDDPDDEVGGAQGAILPRKGGPGGNSGRSWPSNQAWDTNRMDASNGGRGTLPEA